MTPPAASTRLLIATRNEGKTREIRDLFTSLPFQLVFPIDQFLERLPDEADLERGTSFAENAVAKARYFAKRGSIPTLAEDSGLEVDALDGAPPLAKPQLVEATCEGRILSAPRGSAGFGYDPLFFSTELGMTFAEAPMPAKQRVSHRGRAIRALVEVLVRRST